MNSHTNKLGFWTRLKNWLLPPLLLFWLICLPLALLVYTPWAYQVNCHWNKRCERLGTELSKRSMLEISQFFRHQYQLQSPWSETEQLHMQEVRVIYDSSFLVFALISLLLLLEWRFGGGVAQLGRHAKGSLWLIGILSAAIALLSPFFSYFWMEIFHPLVFDNERWRTTPQDISWYLMPKNFFLRVSIFIALSALLLNLLLIRLLPSHHK
ncbi:MAG: hypothetical protein CR991_09105 [Proteobacteria bacterium]|nr:MAG: hypothetical protein CR991_09105 [Pseudomonadota bacterium]